MKDCFNAVVNKLVSALAEDGFELKSQGDFVAVIANSESAARLEYSPKQKLFILYRGTPEDKQADYTRDQAYLFDMDAGDGMQQTTGVANEFADTLRTKRAPVKKEQKKRDPDSDESSASFFVNRIPGVMPECREPLLKHKSHYGRLLPRWFCEEVVTKAMNDALRNGNEKQKCHQFFELLSNMHAQGDLDTKSIIVQVILKAVSERDVEYVESLISADLKKAWAAGRKWYTRQVKPEKVSRMSQLASQYSKETKSGKKPV